MAPAHHTSYGTLYPFSFHSRRVRPLSPPSKSPDTPRSRRSTRSKIEDSLVRNHADFLSVPTILPRSQVSPVLYLSAASSQVSYEVALRAALNIYRKHIRMDRPRSVPSRHARGRKAKRGALFFDEAKNEEASQLAGRK